MDTKTIIYIIIALIVSISIAGFQYFYKNKKRTKPDIFLFLLRALSLFFISLLLINPKVKNSKTEDIKPILSILVDNSLSVKYFNETNFVNEFVEKINKNTAISKKFNVELFSFGKNISVLDSLSFNEVHTNISKGLKQLNDLHKKEIGATILLSDGNQTIGNDYEFSAQNKKVYSLIIGDTTHYEDIRISQINVNKYSYIKNKFPVEIMLYYDGEKSINSTFSITQGGKKIFSEQVSFSADKNTKTITANLTSTKEGIQYYSVGVSKLKNEKNTRNNYKIFSVEVINEQTKVLILSSIMHPDLGALKKSIESNKQRKAEIQLATNFKGKINDYQLVVFYQPNNYFKKYFTERQSNFLLISGKKTDWNFINSLQLGFSKNSLRQTENFVAVYNPKFSTFLQKDIKFSDFPPLSDKFGEISFYTENQPIVFQKIGGVTTEQPLIATFEKNEQKFTTIFGEGFWKWRAASFREEKNFEEFDAFVNNIVQYLGSSKKRNRLEIRTKRIYPANSNITISAMYLNKNYQFDNRASLKIVIKNTATNKTKILPLSLINNSYQVDIEGLSAGSYIYKISVDGQNLNSSGHFKITDYQVEEQFVSSNIRKLERLANKTGGKAYFKHQLESLVQSLITDKELYTIQKSIVKKESLINWKWILFSIIGLLSVEWFLRKYFGKI